jgi:DNA polymerase (family 10)
MPMRTNLDVAQALQEIADLLELRGENPFRVRAYRNAAREVEAQVVPVGERADADDWLRHLPGIGADLAGKIHELARTGSVPILDELRATTPPTLRMLLDVPGLGPKRVRAIHDALGVRTLDELEAAAKDGRLDSVRGVGPKLVERIAAGIAAARGAPGGRRWAWADAARAAEPLLAHLRGARGVTQLDIAGSFRRRRPTVGDLDVLVGATADSDVAERFVRYPGAARILAQGPTRCAIELASGLQVDLRIVTPDCWGAALLYFTGSKQYNVALRALALARDLKLNEYGLWRGTERLASRTEADIYAALDLPWVAPPYREEGTVLTTSHSSPNPQ